MSIIITVICNRILTHIDKLNSIPGLYQICHEHTKEKLPINSHPDVLIINLKIQITHKQLKNVK